MTALDSMSPLYEQVRRRLLADITSGALPVGSFLPPEPDLCERFGVSRVTLRRAVSELCAEGRLTRQQGRGTFVSPPKVRQTLVSLSGFSETMDGLGRPSRHRVLGRDDAPDAPEIAARLDAARLIRFERLLEVDDRPMTHEMLFFDAARFPGAATPVAAGGSFYAALAETAGLRPAGAERQIDVVFAAPRERDLLGIAATQPCYRIAKTVFAEDGTAIALSLLLTPCNLVTFTLKS